ncbi:hypothetical protein GE061_002415 [Apolygus lucorum]|uniref:RNase H type-1 domain-containing protein n=1 Tax=Apolygus lucorum TaxID=248454 RepID=A0A8S9X928_APOLU|nr:hypothetical protein GE061_002415 [Apolygus lucorum]
MGFIETEILNAVNALKLAGTSTTFIWIRGHFNIYGNTIADTLAKQAILLPRRELCEFPASDLNRWFKVQQMKGWDHFHSNYHAGFKYKIMFPQPSSNPWFARMPSHPKTFYRIMSRLRSGHCATKTYLLRIGRVESGMCNVCLEDEDAEHMILVCPIHRNKRRLLFEKIEEFIPRPFNLELILVTELEAVYDAVVTFIVDSEIKL